MGIVGAAPGYRLVDSWTHSVDVANVDFTDLGAYSRLMVIFNEITSSLSGFVQLLASVDNGSVFFSTSGNYQQVAGDGTVTNQAVFMSHGGAGASTARTFYAFIEGNIDGLQKPCFNHANDAIRRLVASTSPINALRIQNSTGNLTGGNIYILGA